MTTTKMKLWAGPRVLVPIATDILLIGENDIPNNGTGINMSSTKANYFNLFLNGSTAAEPFNRLSLTANEFKVGAHMMWTLPHALRKGHQVTDGNVSTDFPFVPNRWLITRLEYQNLDSGTPPKVVSSIVKSDVLSESGFPAPYNESLYPQKLPGSESPVSQVGEQVSLSNWNGDTPSAEKTVAVKAVGPGEMAWSVLYDNVQNVFSFVDDSLSEEATKDHSVFYTYSIIGWFENPENDLLNRMTIPDGSTWEETLKNEFKWTFAKDEDNDLKTALEAWSVWSKAHGLDGIFDPNTLHLPPQEKNAIIQWHTYWLANGQAGNESDLAKQMLCHSMIGHVEWKGRKISYGSGNPLPAPSVPSLTVGSTSVDAISTYIAKEIQENSNTGESPADIPIIARALSAFQNDLLDEYSIDPIKIENLLHATSFGKISAGSEWVVSRIESNTDPKEYTPPTKNAGRQSIPLSEDQTSMLTELNSQQRVLNELTVSIETQRAELFKLIYKQFMIDSIDKPVDSTIKTKVLQSIEALTSNLDLLTSKATAKQTELTSLSTRLAAMLIDASILPEVDLPGYNLKQVDITGYTSPNDPVVAIAGAIADTKLSVAVANNTDQSLAIRYTGQTVFSINIPSFETYPAVLITAEELLNKVAFPSWNAFPKEVMSLWVELLILDNSTSAMLAVIFFEKNNVAPSVYNKPTGAERKTPLEVLTASIASHQTLIWNDPDLMEHSVQTMAAVAGVSGVVPAAAGVAFRTGQPWTPIFMDWKVKWYPTSIDAINPFKNWTLGEIDYVTSSTDLQEDGSFLLTGRAILDPNIAKNIESRLAPLEDEKLDDFPISMREGLRWAARQAGTFDLMTQSLSGFNNQLITKLSDATAFLSSGFQNGNKNKDLLNTAINFLKNDYDSLISILGTTKCDNVDPNVQQYAPIRSGHIQIIDINVVDAFGQVMPAKYDRGGNSNSPIQNVQWSESLSISLAEQKNSYGKLAPRLLQPSKINLNLLQASTKDIIISNSSDATSPICGWVMANHLDNALMVFDSDGKNLGEIIKVQSEDSEGIDNWSIRWDASPGSNTPLGALPDIKDTYLSNFVNELLKTGFKGSDAYDDLMLSIDSTLWTMGTYSKGHQENLSLLIGRPLAVVRGQVGIKTGGNPIYKQYWCNTGDYYNDQGTYKETSPPYLSNTFSLRVGDAYLANNGVMGYFVNNNFKEFYPVYGSDGQTKGLMELLNAGENLDFEPSMVSNGYKSDYMKKDPVLVDSKPNAEEMVQLTMLVDPDGVIPVFAGCLPSVSIHLPFGPVTTALSNLRASFRMGPLLLSPDKVQMPTPAEVRGKWSWIQKKDTVSWDKPTSVSNAIKTGDLYEKPLTLSEGWLDLSNFQSNKEK